MIQRVWYYAMKLYVIAGMRFYFNRIEIHGVENIPRNQALIFAANHQNAFLDALLIATSQPRVVHYLTRAEIFKRPIVKKLLATLNLMPIYRIRDGRQALAMNEEIFKYCSQILAKKETLLIFPEGNHGLWRRLRPLSKGFTRIVYETLLRYPDLPLHIIPVGINYSSHQAYFGNVSIYFDQPVDCRAYFDPGNFQSSSVKLKETLAERMKKIITHIEDPAAYDNLMSQLEASNPDFTKPMEMNKRISSFSPEIHVPIIAKPKRKYKILLPLYFTAWLVNLPMLLLWKRIAKKIIDPPMVGSIKVSVGIFLFPIYYVLVAVGLFSFLDPWIATAVFFLLIFSMPVAQRFYA